MSRGGPISVASVRGLSRGHDPLSSALAVFLALSMVGMACAGENLRSDFITRSDKQIDRLEAIHALGKDLNEKELAAFYAFLKALPGPEEKNLPRLCLLKNDLLDILRHQSEPPSGLTDTLIGIYHNPLQDSVLRDYAIQHLAIWHEQGGAKAAREIRKVLEQATHERCSIAGTALLSLHRLSPRVLKDQVEPDECSAIALRLFFSPETDPAARVTAIQICAERDLRETLPALRNLAEKGESISLRVSAIGALGRLGGPEDAVRLQRIDARENEVLRTALDAALKRLKKEF